MKILTLNTHSIVEPDYEKKLLQFVEVIKKEKPDIFGLQEVNQSLAMPEADYPEYYGYVPCEESADTILKDNHAYHVARLLKEAGVDYNWTWVSAKAGYEIYGEGLALFSRSPIISTEQFYISELRDFNNWKTRKMLGIQTVEGWFYSVHMSWWDDEEEPFVKQWKVVKDKLKARKEACFILGDFNAPSDIREESYDHVLESGWHDTWTLAKEKDGGITVGHVIDGWRERMNADTTNGVRIDYIWCNQEIEVEQSRVVCNGVKEPVVSDHYGVMIKTAVKE